MKPCSHRFGADGSPAASIIARFVCIIVLGLLAAALLSPVSRAFAAVPVKVLFVGNSLTNRNDLPEVFKSYVKAAKPDFSIQTRMIAPDGETLAGHRGHGEVEKAIGAEKWDYVVFQEGNDLVPEYTLNGEHFHTLPTRFYEQQAFFSDLARKHGATPVVFEVWGGKEDFVFVDYASMKAAKADHAVIAPIGRVWRAIKEGGSIGLVGADGSHPNPTGTYLVAATIAQTLFGASLKTPFIALPAGVKKTDVDLIRQVVDREVGRLKQLGGYDPISEPRYSPEVPEWTSGEAVNADSLTGLWHAMDGGIRLSFGTEIDIHSENGQLRLQLRDFSTSALLSPDIKDLQIGQHSLTFKVEAGSVHYTVQLAPEDGSLKVLTGYNSNKTHRIYRSVSYDKNRDDTYFNQLHKLYSVLDTNERELGLAEALKKHYGQLHELTDEATFKKYRQGFPISEWDPIIVAMYYSDRNEHVRALDYYKAAVDLYPESVDANTYYGKGLVSAGRPAEARPILERALTLNAGKSAEITSMLEAELAGIKNK